jgi:trk system potassium uptake protein
VSRRERKHEVLSDKKRRPALSDHPARFVVEVFVAAISIGAVLLALPLSSADGRWTNFVDAAFTSTSAVCVTGLTVLDTGTHWSGFGQAVILVLIELGGLGFMTIASLIMLVVSRRLGLRQTMVANVERSALSFGDVRRMLVRLGFITLAVQAALAIWLTVRFATTYHDGWARAIWSGTFHSVAAFNNAGFGLASDSLTEWRADWLVLVPIMGAIIIGGLGFPVLSDLHNTFVARARNRRHSVRQRWLSLTMHSKVTLATSALLLVAGFVVLAALEWRNPETMGPMGAAEKVLNSAFASVTPRTAGFNTIPVGEMNPASLLVTTALMFIGAGSAGTSGGIKVGTFAILGMVIWSQLRGDEDIRTFGRTVPDNTQRRATTVALLAVGLVVLGAIALLLTRELQFGDALFESVSAFGTVGLSTGITAQLSDIEDFVLMALMLVGRVGPVTLGAALVLRQKLTPTRAPEEAPLIG